MAAERFSSEQVLEQVSTDSAEMEDDESAEVSLKDALEMAISNFSALRPSISSFFYFKEEARKALENVYHRHEDGVHRMDKSLMSSIPAWPMITSEVLMWLTGIRRRMSSNPKASNPWTIEVKRDLPQEIFDIMLDSVKKAPSSFRVSVEETVIKYTHKNRLLRDFSRFACIPKSGVAEKLKKQFGGNRKGFKAEVLTSREKPFLITYSCKRKQVTLACNYGCWNEFGYSFHG